MKVKFTNQKVSPEEMKTKLSRNFDSDVEAVVEVVDQSLSKQPQTITETLQEREKLYGDFRGHARITQDLKQVMRNFQAGQSWDNLSVSMQESLDMIAHKIGRILNGNPTYADSWHDIAGYATLIEQQLNEFQVTNEVF